MVLIVAWAALAQGPGLFSQVVPQPTGKNGFEEYLRAAERTDDPAFRQWLAIDQPGLAKDQGWPSGLDRESSCLGRARWVLNRYGVVNDLIRQGNGKPVYEPRAKIAIDTRFPEYRSLRNLSRVMVVSAYAEYAAGQTAQGTDRLLQSITMGQNLAGIGTGLAHSYGQIQMRAAFDALDSRLGQLSLEDCRKVDRHTSQLLQQPLTTYRIFVQGAAFLRLALDAIEANPKEAAGLEAPLRETIAGLKGPDLKRFRQEADRIVAERYDPLIRHFQGPEAQWSFPVENRVSFRKGGDIESMAAALVDALDPSYRGIAILAIASRTQLRLLRLHALIRGYRWEHDRWPSRLDEVATDFVDPLTREPFEYRLNPDGYTLSSRGRPETGPITLRSTTPPRLSLPIDP